VLTAHLHAEHPGVLSGGTPMLGEVLRQMLVDMR
jgi:hypothetical protein